MSINLGSAYGKIEVDSSGVTKGVKNAQDSMNSLKSKSAELGLALQNLGKTMTVAVSIPLALMAKDAIMAASAYEESLNKVKVVFEKNSDAIISWSENASKNLKMTKQEALEAAATFGNLFDTIGLTADKNAEMSMSLVQLAADMASLHNISPEEALMKLRSGLVGEVEPLRTVGVLLNETAVKAKAMEMGLANSNGELSEAAKVQARYALILEQTVNAQGDLARTSGSFANQLRGLKSNWGDFLKIVGDQLLPIVTKLLTKLNEFLEWFNNAPPYVQKMIIAIGVLLFVIGPLLFVVGKLLPLAFSGATKSFSPFSGGIFSLIGTIVKWIGVAAMIVRVLGFLGISTGAVGTFILGLQSAIAGVGVSLLSILGPILLIIGALALLYWAFSTNFMGIRTTAQQLWVVLKYYFAQGWQALLQVSQQRAMQLLGWMRTLATRLRDTFRSINWQEVGRYIMLGLANGMLGGLPLIINAATKAAQTVLATLKKTLDSHSPSRKTAIEGLNAAKGFTGGLDAGMNESQLMRTFSRPIQAAAQSTNQTVQMNFANGVTVRQVQQMLQLNNDQLIRKLNVALGGA